jgi:predicted Rossmann-fold nucleotide-binding protein
MIIAVIGGDDAPPEAFVLAEAVGREIARRGAKLNLRWFGWGHGIGMPWGQGGGRYDDWRAAGHRSGEANAYVDIPIVTAMNQARNLVIVRSADAVIAIGGGYGTLSEMAFALRLGKPLVGLQTWSMQYAGQPVQFETFEDAKTAVERAVALADARAGVTRHA